MEPLDYLRILRRRWALIAAATCLSTLVAVGMSLLSAPSSPTWVATRTVLLKGSQPDLGTLAALAVSDPVAKGAAEALRRTDVENLRSKVSAVPSEAPGLLKISAQANSAQEAEDIATRFTTELIRLVNAGEFVATTPTPSPPAKQVPEGARQRLERLRNEIARLKKEFLRRIQQAQSQLELQRAELLWTVQTAEIREQADVIESAIQSAVEAGSTETVPPAQAELVLISAPQPQAQPVDDDDASTPLSAGIGILVGLVGGSAIALAVEYFDPRIRTVEQAAQGFGFPVVSQVSVSGDARPGIEDRDEASLDLLAVSLDLSDPPGGMEPSAQVQLPRIIIITSSDTHQGKGWVVAGLARAMIRNGRRVSVLLCDEDDESLDVFGVGRPTSDRVEACSQSELGKFLQVGDTAQVQGLSLICPPAGYPGKRVGATEIRQAVTALSPSPDWILIDAPPVTSRAAALDLVAAGDAVLVVAALGLTLRNSAVHCGDALRAIQAPVTGVVTTTFA